MKKSVEDLLSSSQDVINNSLNQALTTASSFRERRRSPSPSSRSINLATSSPRANSLFGKCNKSETLLSPSSTSKLDINEDLNNKSSDSSINVPSADTSKSQEDLKESRDTRDSKDKAKTNNPKVADRARKKAWYHGLYPSYKSRCEDFKKLFKDVPDDERLLVGKQRVAKVLPTAISVESENDKYFLTSFTSRDKTFLILFKIWQNALMEKSMDPQELWQWVHSCYGEQLGLTSDDEDYIDPNESKQSADSVSEEPSNCDKSDTKASSSSSSKLNESSDKKESKKDSKKDKKEKKETKKDKIKIKKSSKLFQKENACNVALNPLNPDFPLETELPKIISAAELLPTDMSDSTDSESESKMDPFINDAECTSMHEGRQLVHTIVPINIDTMFSLLFSKSKFFTDFHNARKTTDLIQGEWIENAEGLKERVLSLTIAITQTVGPKSSHVTETQIMRTCSKPGQLYSIDATSVNAGIPYADSFYVLLHYCLKRTSDDHTVISVHAQIKYKKSVWGVVKGFIEKNTWVGLEEFYKALVQSMQQELSLVPAKTKSRRPKRQSTSIQTQPPIIPASKPVFSHDEIPQKNLKTQHSFVRHHSIIDDRKSRSNTNNYNKLSWIVIILLLGLIIFNVILYVKLWKLEERGENFPDISSMKNPPKTPEDWLRLLQLQESLHAKEMKQWHRVLNTALELLKKTEQSLSDLQHLIMKQRSKSPTEKIDAINYKKTDFDEL